MGERPLPDACQPLESMNTYLYTVCPHCEHPNVHVSNGYITEHTVSLSTSTRCSGSGLDARETHIEPMNRHTEEYRTALAKYDPGLFKNEPPLCFTTWEFSGIQFIAVPIDRGNVHIADCFGNNYGSWMSVTEFRKRQRSGVLRDWQALGKAHLNVVSER